MVAKKVKLEKYISDNEEIKFPESKLDARRDKQATQYADAKFITDEYTQDGKNVDITLIKKAFTEQQILESEESASDGGSDSYMKSSTKFEKFWGVDHSDKAGKGQDAVDFLLEVKSGHVVGAFNHKDLGDIDLVWGDSKAGLQHIIERRTS